jgi:D-arabinose 1-dehydrogenase-like Zn-dependent alcohol dehydrogenase
VSLNPGLVIVKELEILGAYATTRSELDEAFGLLRGEEIRPHVAEVLPLAEAAHAHDLLERRSISGRLVLRPN